MGAPRLQSSSASAIYERAELSDDALSRLESLELIPLDDRCTADGFDYDVLTVTDAYGTFAEYADTGCHYLRFDGAAAMLSFEDVKGLRLAGE
jgi:hypothetical protein